MAADCLKCITFEYLDDCGRQNHKHILKLTNAPKTDVLSILSAGGVRRPVFLH